MNFLDAPQLAVIGSFTVYQKFFVGESRAILRIASKREQDCEQEKFYICDFVAQILSNLFLINLNNILEELFLLVLENKFL